MISDLLTFNSNLYLLISLILKKKNKTKQNKQKNQTKPKTKTKPQNSNPDRSTSDMYWLYCRKKNSIGALKDDPKVAIVLHPAI